MPYTDTQHSSSQRTPQIAIIGCGAIAELYYLPAIAKRPSILKNLTLVDKKESRTNKLAREYKISRTFDDYRKLFDKKIDGVIIAVPTYLHHSIALPFLRRGIHTLCEKPLTASASKAEEMANKAGQSGAALLVNQTRRLWPSTIKIKDMLEKKVLGELLSIKFAWIEKFGWPTISGFYFDSEVSPRGTLLDTGVHVFDTICYWLGEKPTLLSSQNDSFGGPEATAQVKFKYDNCVGEVLVSVLEKSQRRYGIQCEKGTISGEIYDINSFVVTKNNGSKHKVTIKSNVNTFEEVGQKMVDNFIDVITTDAKPLVSGTDVLPTMSFLDECYHEATKFSLPWYGKSSTYKI